MKKTYSYFAVLGLAVASLSSCSRANYAANTTQPTPAATSIAQAPAPAAATADLSAQVAAKLPATETVTVAPEASVSAAPVAAKSRRVVAAVPAQAAVAAADFTPAQTTKPSLVQRLALKKLTKQLAKAESRQQNTANVTHTAAHGGSLTILLVGLVALLIGIIAGSGFLITAGSIVAVIGLVLLLLKAL